MPCSVVARKTAKVDMSGLSSALGAVYKVRKRNQIKTND